MDELVVALAQINVTVGDLEANAAKIAAAAAEAARRGAALIVFPELALSGYPPEDLVLKRHFLRACEETLEALAALLPRDAATIVGSPCAGPEAAFNAAYVFANGGRAAVYRKMLLPNYGVFDEKRVFAPGDRALVFALGGFRVGVHICEDSWAAGECASAPLAHAGLDLLVNLSASPYHRGKAAEREAILRRMGGFLGTQVAYCNLVGGQDELVFDGGSMVLDARGRLVARAAQFEEEILCAAVPRLAAPGEPPLPPACEHAAIELSTGDAPAHAAAARVAPQLPDAEEVYRALVLGLRDYVDKNGFSRAVVALSGGIDSALVAAVAADALGPARVVGVTMPSQYSSAETLGDAGELARRLGIELHTVPIREMYEALAGRLAPFWQGRGPDTAEENLQARIRGVIIMAFSNKFGWLVLTTGNKSELATGYCTLYGDMAGGFAVIKDVPKTLVYELADWRNARGGAEAIPRSIIDRPPSAELRPNQKDSDSLPPYEILDPILERYVEKDMALEAIVAEGFDPAAAAKAIRLVDGSEYKRRQGAPGIKITPRAFGRDRRMPITNRYRPK